MYFTAKVKVRVEKDNGGFKKETWPYLVNAVSVTDVEAKITEKMTGSVNDWELVSVSETKLVEVIE